MTPTLILLAFGGWGAACAVPVGTPAPAYRYNPALRIATPVYQPAPAFIPAPAPVAIPAPPPLDADAVRRLVADAVERRFRIEAEAAKLRAGDACVGSCVCSKCEDACPCRAGSGRCGDGCACVVEVGQLPTGVDWDKISPKDSYSDEKGASTRREVIRKIEAAGDPSLTDDSAKPHLTVIGDEAFRKKVLADLGSTPGAGLALLQAYDPGAEILKGRGLTPGVWLQKRDGTRLGTSPITAEGYSPAALAGLVAWADPLYKPAPPPAPKPGPASPGEIPAAWLVAGGLGLLLLMRKGR
jgi:hypothetical protein